MGKNLKYLTLLFITLAIFSCKDKIGEHAKASQFSPGDTVLVLVQEVAADIKTDVRYATMNNFIQLFLINN